MFCNSCGKFNNDDASYCSGCGSKLNKSVSNVEQSNQILTVENSTSNSEKKSPKIIFGLLALIILGLIIAIVFITSNKDDENDVKTSENKVITTENSIETSETKENTSITENTQKKFYTSKIDTINYDSDGNDTRNITWLRKDGQVELKEKYYKGDLTSKTQIFYDSDGKAIKTISESGEKIYEFNYEYVKKDGAYIGTAIRIDGEDEKKEEIIYKNGEMVSAKSFNNGELVSAEYWENEYKRVVIGTMFGVKDKTVFEFDENKRLVCLSSYTTGDSNSTEMKLSYKTTNKYDERGNVIETINYDKNETITSRVIVDYNDKNIPIMVQEYDGNGICRIYSKNEKTDEKIILSMFREDELYEVKVYTFSGDVLISQKCYDENDELYSYISYNEYKSPVEEVLYMDGELDMKTVYEYTEIQ